MRRTFATLAALALAACGEPTEGENADDFAARVDAGGAAAAPDGALYRMQNEDVPFDDVTPDRAYRLAAAGQ